MSDKAVILRRQHCAEPSRMTRRIGHRGPVVTAVRGHGYIGKENLFTLEDQGLYTAMAASRSRDAARWASEEANSESSANLQLGLGYIPGTRRPQGVGLVAFQVWPLLSRAVASAPTCKSNQCVESFLVSGSLMGCQ